MSYPENLKYTESHEWAKQDGGDVVIGITDFAVQSLQDLVFIDLPKVGAKVEKGKRFGEIESVKAVSDLNAPVTGTITAVNTGLLASLDPLVKDAYGAGWMIKVKADGADALAGLLDAATYEKVAAAGHH